VTGTSFAANGKAKRVTGTTLALLAKRMPEHRGEPPLGAEVGGAGVLAEQLLSDS